MFTCVVQRLRPGQDDTLVIPSELWLKRIDECPDPIDLAGGRRERDRNLFGIPMVKRSPSLYLGRIHCRGYRRFHGSRSLCIPSISLHCIHEC